MRIMRIVGVRGIMRFIRNIRIMEGSKEIVFMRAMSLFP